jgi:tellurite resistance protein
MDLQIEEIIGIVAVLFFGYLIIQKTRGASEGRLKAEEVQELSGLKIKVHREHKQRESVYLNIQCKGLIPICTKTSIGFTISVMTENNNGKSEPVLSMISSFQEPKSTAFQDLTQIGKVDEHHGFENWTTVGVVPTEILQPATGGNQKLKIIVMLVDMDNFPEIVLGLGRGGISTFTEDCNHHFNIKGYHEEGAHINEARALSIKIGVAVAMSDGKFDDTERNTLDRWIKKMIMPFDREKQIMLKDLYNKAKEEAEGFFSDLDEKDRNSLLDMICKELHDIGEEVQKYEALELAHEVMVADGMECKDESKCIHRIAKNLGISADEIESIRAHKIHKLDSTISDDKKN